MTFKHTAEATLLREFAKSDVTTFQMSQEQLLAAARFLHARAIDGKFKIKHVILAGMLLRFADHHEYGSAELYKLLFKVLKHPDFPLDLIEEQAAKITHKFYAPVLTVLTHNIHHLTRQAAIYSARLKHLRGRLRRLETVSVHLQAKFSFYQMLVQFISGNQSDIQEESSVKRALSINQKAITEIEIAIESTDFYRQNVKRILDKYQVQLVRLFDKLRKITSVPISSLLFFVQSTSFHTMSALERRNIIETLAKMTNKNPALFDHFCRFSVEFLSNRYADIYDQSALLDSIQYLLMPELRGKFITYLNQAVALQQTELLPFCPAVRAKMFHYGFAFNTHAHLMRQCAAFIRKYGASNKLSTRAVAAFSSFSLNMIWHSRCLVDMHTLKQLASIDFSTTKDLPAFEIENTVKLIQEFSKIAKAEEDLQLYDKREIITDPNIVSVSEALKTIFSLAPNYKSPLRFTVAGFVHDPEARTGYKYCELHYSVYFEYGRYYFHSSNTIDMLRSAIDANPDQAAADIMSLVSTEIARKSGGRVAAPTLLHIVQYSSQLDVNNKPLAFAYAGNTEKSRSVTPAQLHVEDVRLTGGSPIRHVQSAPVLRSPSPAPKFQS